MPGLYGILQTYNGSSGEPKNALTHAAIFLLSAKKELNLKRRDFIRPYLNKQYDALCNPSTSISTYLFGDDLNNEVEELSKSNKLSNKVTSMQFLDHTGSLLAEACAVVPKAGETILSQKKKNDNNNEKQNEKKSNNNKKKKKKKRKKKQ